jgi:hypothetical protein
MLAHDLFGKPAPTFPDHALEVLQVSRKISNADDHRRRLARAVAVSLP